MGAMPEIKHLTILVLCPRRYFVVLLRKFFDCVAAFGLDLLSISISLLHGLCSGHQLITLCCPVYDGDFGKVDDRQLLEAQVLG